MPKISIKSSAKCEEEFMHRHRTEERERERTEEDRTINLKTKINIVHIGLLHLAGWWVAPRETLYGLQLGLFFHSAYVAGS